MATDETREPRAERPRPISEPQRVVGGNAPRAEENSTQMGQVMQEISRLTRRLPNNRSRTGGTSRANRAPASRERIAMLVAALDDSSHPQHANAVEELVAIGPPAVPALCAALSADGPWLAAYRASEALAQIGDGRATGALNQALQHPNSNVRWGAVRALTQVGDTRTPFLLRRVAQEDRGKTSWGEPVAGAAQSAIDQLRAQSPWSQGVALAKTAITCVLMILSLVLAFSVYTMLREELGRIGQGVPGGAIVRPAPLLATAVPTEAAQPTATSELGALLEPTPTGPGDALPNAELALSPTPLPGFSDVITGTVLQDANVRPIPSSVENVPVGRVAAGDEVVFLTISPDGRWYRVELGQQRNSGSAISSLDGTGWVSSSLVTPPGGVLPTEEVVLPTPEAEATPTP